MPTYTYSVPEGEETEKGTKNVFEEIMDESIPNLKTAYIQIQEAKWIWNKKRKTKHNYLSRYEKSIYQSPISIHDKTLNKMSTFDEEIFYNITKGIDNKPTHSKHNTQQW